MQLKHEDIGFQNKEELLARMSQLLDDAIPPKKRKHVPWKISYDLWICEVAHGFGTLKRRPIHTVYTSRSISKFRIRTRFRQFVFSVESIEHLNLFNFMLHFCEVDVNFLRRVIKKFVLRPEDEGADLGMGPHSLNFQIHVFKTEWFAGIMLIGRIRSFRVGI